jgi:4-amino-4-deoxy-L-arabinose transferase-like glycosyltransferase
MAVALEWPDRRVGMRRYRRGAVPRLLASRLAVGLVLTAIVAVGGGLRAWQAANPTALYQSADELNYGKLALDIAERNGYGTHDSGLKEPLHWPPGAPVLFAAAHTLDPQPTREVFYDIPAAYWAQAAVSTATILVVFALAFLLAGAGAGLLAAAAVAAYPGAIIACGDMLSEPLGGFLLALGMLGVVWAWRRRHGAWAFALAGGALGAAVLTRADLLLVPLVVAPVAVLGLRRLYGWPRALGAGTALVVGSLMVIGPWVVYASHKAGEFVPVTRGSAAAFFVGTYLPGHGTTVGMKRALGDAARARNPKLHGVPDYELQAQSVLGVIADRHPDMSPQDALNYEGKKNLVRYGLGDPPAFAKMMAGKAWRMWKRYTRGGGHHTLPSLEILHLVLIGLAFLGLAAGIALARGRRLLLAAVAVPVVYSTLLHTLVVSQPRYNLPLVPLVLAAGSAGALAIYRQQQRAQQQGRAEVADLGTQEFVVHHRRDQPGDEDDRRADPGDGRPARAAAG